MGAPVTKLSTTHHYDLDGNDNKIWIINGLKFDIASIINQTVLMAIDQTDNIIMLRNSVVLRNILSIIAIIALLYVFVLLLVFLQNRFCKQRERLHSVTSSTKEIYPSMIPVVHLTGSEKVLSKDMSKSLTGEIV